MRLSLLLALMAFTAGCPTAPEPTLDDVLARGACAAVPTGPGTVHATDVTADQTWTAAGSPHLLKSIRVEATVTIEPCAVVVLEKGAKVQVGNSGAGAPGKVVAAGRFEGAKLEPVVFRAQRAGEFWGSLFVLPTGSLDLTWTALVNGGSADVSDTTAAIEARGEQQKPVRALLRLRHVFIKDSGAQGLTLRHYAGFAPDSEALVVTGAGAQPEADVRFPTGYALDAQPAGLNGIPRGSALTGNRREGILVRAVTRLDVDEAFVDRGVPYVIDGPFLMYDLGRSTLTLRLEAGVTLKFSKRGAGDVGLVLGDAASRAPVRLVAQGTADRPIVLTSAEGAPAPGDWAGVRMNLGASEGNAFEFVTVAFAGGATGANGYGCGPRTTVGGLLLIDWRPDTAFVKFCTFRDLLGAGVVSGWSSDAAGPDLSGTNTFSNVLPVPMEGACNVTRWAPAAGVGSCPGTRPLCVN
ncbi:MAG: hypothetical protein INH41_16235 [Myxococcaceae bacterium]|jgi:hypothetical protein|nr:hypothetical protein [Myxococcaceae bacterium]MCA3013930.1 hypothetical protein [Myxococcaceae bacterium]